MAREFSTIQTCRLLTTTHLQLLYSDPKLELAFDVPNWKDKASVLASKVASELRELGFSQHKSLPGHWATLMGNDYYALQELYPQYYRARDNATFTCAAPNNAERCTVSRADLRPSTFDELHCCLERDRRQHLKWLGSLPHVAGGSAPQRRYEELGIW